MQQLAVVYFPSIDSDILNDFRKKYDPGYKIIDPHITLVQPLSGISEESLITHLETIAKEIESFSITLSGITKSSDNYLFLQVKEGNEKICNVHKRLYSGILAQYLQADFTFEPHITLGYFGKENNKLFNKANEEVQRKNMNLTCDFNNLSLIKGDGVTPAKIIRIFKLSF